MNQNQIVFNQGIFGTVEKLEKNFLKNGFSL